MLETDQVVASGSLGYPADRTQTDLQLDPAGGLSVLHVVVKAGATNSQYNEHCLPVSHERRITVCSLFPAEVVTPPEIALVQGDGTVRGCFRALREALSLGSYDVVHVHAAASGVLTLAVYLAYRRPRDELVFTLHTSWPNLKPRNRLFLCLIAATFPTFVACGDASARSLPRWVRRLARRLEVIPNGVDVGRIDRVVGDRRKPAAPEGRVGLVVSAGRLIRSKDPATVVRAFERVARPGDRLLLVGEGDLHRRLAEDVDRIQGDGVALTGLLPREEVHALLHEADVFVSASTVEGLPVAVLEAMTARCQVVLSDIPPHREIAARAPSVRLVPPGDVTGFVAALEDIAATSPEARRQEGEALRRCAVEHFSVSRMNHAYGRVYARTARERSRRAPRRARTARGAVAWSTVRRVAHGGTAALLGAGAAFGYGYLHTPKYEADVTLAVGNASVPLSEDVLEDRLGSAADMARLVRRQPVLGPVARRLGVDNWRSLRSRVAGGVGSEDHPSVVVTASASSAPRAEQLAGAVAEQLRALTGGWLAVDPVFAEREVERLRQEISAAETRLDALLAIEAEPASSASSRDQAVIDLTTELTALKTRHERLLEWSSQADRGESLTIAARTSGRAAPPLPDLPAIAAAGGAAGACLWVAASLLLRRDTGSAPGRPGTEGHATGDRDLLPAGTAGGSR